MVAHTAAAEDWAAAAADRSDSSGTAVRRRSKSAEAADSEPAAARALSAEHELAAEVLEAVTSCAQTDAHTGASSDSEDATTS